jgi:OmpA-OmpF porin, OOP family
VTTACPEKSDWPHALAEAHLVMVGVGHPAAGQPIPQTGHVQWLRLYWERICQVAQAASCNVSVAPVRQRDDSPGANPHSDPPVAFAPGGGAPTLPPRHVYNLQSTVLFDTDSHDLRPEGEAHLARLATEIKASERRSVEVVGHTDSRDDDAHNQDLSERRAVEVAKVLRGNGVTVVGTRGAGEREPLCRAEKRPDGTWDQACLQRNRRVEIVVTEQDG